MKLHTCSVQKLSELIHKKEISAGELFRALLDRVQKVEKKTKGFLTLPSEEWLADCDGHRSSPNRDSRLFGIPLAIKDNICTLGMKTTCGSKILENFLPTYDAAAVRRLKDAGCILFGKTNMDEFAMGSSCENSAFQITRNPWDLERVPGGSSGGSAAVVASGMCPAALGSDTGGSVRQPASFCGIVGLKPTYGRISRCGLVAFASSLDQIGIMTRNTYDNALILSAAAGWDQHDSTSAQQPPEDFTEGIDDGIRKMKLGFPVEYFGAGLDQEVRSAIMDTLKDLVKEGADVVEISLPHTDHAIPAYYLTATSEASSNLARYDGVRYSLRTEEDLQLSEMYRATRSEGFGQEVKRRIMLGTYALSAGYYDAYYLKAQKVRTLIQNDYEEAFQKIDAICTPTAPTAAFKIGEKVTDPLEMYLSDIYTVTANLAGIPAISVPCGFSTSGLPIGMQIQAPLFDEKTLYRIAYALEENLQLKDRIAEP
jgi:aspartyl-tRNA(Asn)/glutamyl-tRNA(Gln) amidotransferase subunit A